MLSDSQVDPGRGCVAREFAHAVRSAVEDDDAVVLWWIRQS